MLVIRLDAFCGGFVGWETDFIFTGHLGHIEQESVGVGLVPLASDVTDYITDDALENLYRRPAQELSSCIHPSVFVLCHIPISLS